MSEWILYYLLGINLVAFCAMGMDKRRARKKKWRIKERTLFLFVLLGGGLGGTLGMHKFRHKTKHWYFRFGFPAIMLLEYAGLAYLVLKYILCWI